jgi:hypothetical protein
VIENVNPLNDKYQRIAAAAAAAAATPQLRAGWPTGMH